MKMGNKLLILSLIFHFIPWLMVTCLMSAYVGALRYHTSLVFPLTMFLMISVLEYLRADIRNATDTKRIVGSLVADVLCLIMQACVLMCNIPSDEVLFNYFGDMEQACVAYLMPTPLLNCLINGKGALGWAINIAITCAIPILNILCIWVFIVAEVVKERNNVSD